MNIKNIMLFSPLMLLILEAPTSASTVKLINKTKNPVMATVIAKNTYFLYCKKCLWSCLQGEVNIFLPIDDFRKHGNSFAIVDINGGFLGSGQCKDLSILKNYEIEFSESFFGTRCQYREI